MGFHGEYTLWSETACSLDVYSGVEEFVAYLSDRRSTERAGKACFSVSAALMHTALKKAF